MLFIFIDGLGLGDPDPAVNPLARAATPVLRSLLDGPLALPAPRRTGSAVLVPLDACLGVAGLPQSATGQVALLTGQNAAVHIGRHLTAYPTPSLAALLEVHGLFGALRRRGVSVALANAYTPAYFDAVAARRLRHGAVTLHALQAGVRLRGADDLAAGQAVYQDLTNARAKDLGAEVTVVTPEEAGRNLAGISAAHRFTMFEFFQSDLAGHGRVPDAVGVIERLDRFLGGVLSHVDLATTLLVLTSDHGNLEDARTQAHTTNAVPALLAGAHRDAIASRLRAITDVAPACLDLLADGAGDAAAADGPRPSAEAGASQPLESNSTDLPRGLASSIFARRLWPRTR
jgi:2,3-bisphosphoglycerate-independent phosphoglycerate mutase